MDFAKSSIRGQRIDSADFFRASRKIFIMKELRVSVKVVLGKILIHKGLQVKYSGIRT